MDRLAEQAGCKRLALQVRKFQRYKSTDNSCVNNMSNISAGFENGSATQCVNINALPENVYMCVADDPEAAKFKSSKRLKGVHSLALSTSAVIDSDNEGYLFQSSRKSARRTEIVQSGTLPMANRFSALASSGPEAEVAVSNDEPADSPSTGQAKEPRPEPIYLKMTLEWRTHIMCINELAGEELKKKATGELVKSMSKDITQ